MTREVLIIEDEQELARILKRHREELSCAVQLAFAGDTGLKLAESRLFDLVLLDLMLPGLDRLEVCLRLRAGRVYTSIIMLTARSTEVDKVLGLEMGADDYLTKPFSVAELTARVKAIFRPVDALTEQAEEAPRRMLWRSRRGRLIRTTRPSRGGPRLTSASAPIRLETRGECNE